MSSPELAAPRVVVWPLPELQTAAAGPAVSAAEARAAAVDEAYAQGLTDGERVAQERLDREMGGALRALAGATESLQAVQAALAAEMEEGAYVLAVTVAQRIVEREVAADPSIVRDLVRRAVDVFPLDTTLEIRLHPEDLAALEHQLELYVAGGRRLEARWVADAAVERGGYVIETPQRVVDGRVDSALRAMYERLRDA